MVKPKKLEPFSEGMVTELPLDYIKDNILSCFYNTMEFYLGLNSVNRNLEDFLVKRKICESTNISTMD